eukprot:TRINITY_DN8072_c0_g1_i2.p1 TRINITY_DN8072_c0_g1~~TRINITY_DN8072_c0_g1_i2.p1  ORF type:complete len:149 (+),score=6.67 TRINITY_DN8072_c0_g1_i2:637-1083(+)
MPLDPRLGRLLEVLSRPRCHSGDSTSAGMLSGSSLCDAPFLSVVVDICCRLEGFVQLEQAVDKTGGQCEVDLRFNIVVHSLYDAVCKVIQSRSISKYGIDRKVPEVDRTFYEEGVGAEEPDEIIYVEDSEQDHDLVLSPRVSESMMWT